MLFAGTDTTSTALSRILWLLARNPEAQDRLRQEILDAQKGTKELDYDALVGLPYTARIRP